MRELATGIIAAAAGLMAESGKSFSRELIIDGNPWKVQRAGFKNQRRGKRLHEKRRRAKLETRKHVRRS